mgnify:CR=1 FL=1
MKALNYSIMLILWYFNVISMSSNIVIVKKELKSKGCIVSMSERGQIIVVTGLPPYGSYEV